MIFFNQVSKQYDDGTEAVANLTLEVREGEVMVLLGRSGCGKTTIMKMINRLVEPSSGQVIVDGMDAQSYSKPVLRRKIGYAIQSIGLFPHMTVGENIGLGPKLLGWSDEVINARVEHLLCLVGLNAKEFKNRYPKELSGGQKQRVGVARALGTDPPIILMDEPFGALDPITRKELQEECLQLFLDLKKTVVFVTHDIFEAVTVGNRIALLDKGRLIQLSTPEELIQRPVNDIATQFIQQHRFQLSLLTQTLKSHMHLLHANSLEAHQHKLSCKDSLIDALDVFKLTGKQILPVYTGKDYQGSLSKDKLISQVIELLKREEVIL